MSGGTTYVSKKSISTLVHYKSIRMVVGLISAKVVSANRFGLVRWISSTTHLTSWMDRVKGVVTGQKPTSENDVKQDFTLLRFTEEMSKARKVGSLQQYIPGRGAEAAYANSILEKQEGILRVLGGFDPTGDNIKTAQKQEAAKQCNCTLADVENALSKFTWAKEAQRKLEKMKEEGKPMPTSLAEVQKLMGSTPMDVARTNLAKSGQISRNQPCPCGSQKKYKRCCAKETSK